MELEAQSELDKVNQIFIDELGWSGVKDGGFKTDLLATHVFEYMSENYETDNLYVFRGSLSIPQSLNGGDVSDYFKIMSEKFDKNNFIFIPMEELERGCASFLIFESGWIKELLRPLSQISLILSGNKKQQENRPLTLGMILQEDELTIDCLKDSEELFNIGKKLISSKVEDVRVRFQTCLKMAGKLHEYLTKYIATFEPECSGVLEEIFIGKEFEYAVQILEMIFNELEDLSIVNLWEKRSKDFEWGIYTYKTDPDK